MLPRGLILAHRLWRWANINPTSVQRILLAGRLTYSGQRFTPSNTRYWPNVSLRLAHRLRHWPNIKPTVVHCLVFASDRVTCLFNYCFCSAIFHHGPVFPYKLRYIVGFWLVEMAISTNQKPAIYRNLYENTGTTLFSNVSKPCFIILFRARFIVSIQITRRNYSAPIIQRCNSWIIKISSHQRVH